MATKESASEKAAAARKAAADLRAKQRAASRRRTLLAAVGALALVAVFVGIVLFIVKGGSDDSGPYAVYNNGVLKAPTAADDSGGIFVGPGGVAGGEAPDGVVRVDTYEDPICPFCGLFVAYAAGELGSLVEAGKISLYLHPISYFDDQSLGNHYSTRAVNAMATVAEYDPEHFWAFVDILFVNQPAEGTTGLTNAQIEDLAVSVGVSQEAVSRIADGEFTQWVVTASSQASVDGVHSTPTLLIGGVEFHGWITSDYQIATGAMSAAVAYVEEHGAEAFANYLEALQTPTPSPSPSASA